MNTVNATSCGYTTNNEMGSKMPENAWGFLTSFIYNGYLDDIHLQMLILWQLRYFRSLQWKPFFKFLEIKTLHLLIIVIHLLLQRALTGWQNFIFHHKDKLSFSTRIILTYNWGTLSCFHLIEICLGLTGMANGSTSEEGCDLFHHQNTTMEVSW